MKISLKSRFAVVLVLTFIVFALVPRDYTNYLSSMWIDGIIILWITAGWALEDINRKGIEQAQQNGKTLIYVKNTFFDPHALNRSWKLQFLRLWYFTVAWPLFLWKAKITQK